MKTRELISDITLPLQWFDARDNGLHRFEWQLIQSIGEMATVKLPGGIIVLELNNHDYSLAQIARIVEDNDAKILSSYVTFSAGSVKMEVTLKINRVDVTSILQSFRRFDYTIKASYQSADRNEDILRNNYDQFMMYLNV